ncbi:hypothetical protein [Fontivita pretiosa]|uniref:hypothetical protein n=1 Tax=Fontivita pretiosa TaxID=2989684 RepID=UPI003D173D04
MNNDPITFIVGRWGYWDSTLSVQLFAPAGTAAPGDDYTGMPTTVVIPGNDQPTATTTFTITPVDDDVYEEPESVYVILKASSNYWLTTAFTAAGTIADNDLNMVAYRTGLKLGYAVSRALLDSSDPTKYLVLTNNDIEQELEGFAPDFSDDIASIGSDGTGAVDDDLVRLTLQKIPADLSSGTYQITLSDPSAVRLFKSDGSLLYKEGTTSATVLTLYLSSPSGYLAGLQDDDVDVYLEALKPDEDFVLTISCDTNTSEVVGSRSVHMEFASWTFGGIAPGTIGVVSQATRTSWDEQARLYYGVGDPLTDANFPPFSVGAGEQPLLFSSGGITALPPSKPVDADETILRQTTIDQIAAVVNDGESPGQITSAEAATIDLTNAEAMHLMSVTGMGLPYAPGTVHDVEPAWWATDWVAANPGKTVDDYYHMRATEYNVMRARIGLVKNTIPAVNLYARLVSPTADLITLSVMAPVAIPAGGARLVQASAAGVNTTARTAAAQANRWADELIITEQATLIREMRVLASTIKNLPRPRPTMISGASDLGTLEHFYEYSGSTITRVPQGPDIHPTLSLRMKSITDRGIETMEDWVIPNCAEFKLVNNALWDGVDEQGLILGTMRVSDFTLESRCRNCVITVQAPRIFSDPHP